MASASSLRKGSLRTIAPGILNESISNPSRRRLAPWFAESILPSTSSRHLSKCSCVGLYNAQFNRHFSTARTSRLIVCLPYEYAPISRKVRDHHVHNSQKIQMRWSSNGSVNNMPYPIRIPTTPDPPQEPKTPQPPAPRPRPSRRKDYKKSKRKNPAFSGLSQLAATHPKSTTPITHAPLTRKQLLRLSARQRANLKQYQIEQREASRTYLDHARSNARSNLKFLKGTAESNLKKNVGFFKRLWKGEDVWKDETPIKVAAKQSAEKQEPLHWDRLPSAIQSNVQSNIAALQNYLHKFTDGAIPSPHLSTGNSSVALRLRNFNEAKENQSLNMDKVWIAKNVVLALLPGAMVGIYCKSKEEEMKRFYAGMERREREKILGVGNGGVADGTASENGDANRMGLSFALIAEGGGVWDKVKMAVNDLFLGGMNEKMKMAKESGDDAGSDESIASGNTHQSTTKDVQTPYKVANKTTDEDDKDATIETLLRRIQALEIQVGMDAKPVTGASAEKQSPIQMRREERLKAQWQKAEEEKKMLAEPNDNGGSSSLSSLMENAKSLMQMDSVSAIEWAKGKALELFPRSLRVVVKQPESQIVHDGGAVANAENETQPKEIDDAKEVARISVDTSSEETAVQNDAEDNQSEDPIDQSQGRLGRWWSRIRRRKRKEEQMAVVPIEESDKSTK